MLSGISPPGFPYIYTDLLIPVLKSALIISQNSLIGPLLIERFPILTAI